MQNICITAHAGAENTSPNTLESIRYLATLPVYALEVDVRMVHGVLRLGHDPEHALAGPTLAECMETVAGLTPSMHINCDMKEKHLIHEVLRLAVACGMAHRLVFTGEAPDAEERKAAVEAGSTVWMNSTRFPKAQKALFASAPACVTEHEDTRMQWLMEHPQTQLEELEADIRDAKASQVPCLNLCHLALIPDGIRRILENGLQISAWTVDSLPRFRELTCAGVQYVTSRAPLRLLNDLQSSGKP